jgi:hypothetical protein
MEGETQMHLSMRRSESCSSASARLAGVVAEDEPALALAAGIHNGAFGRRRELLEHLGVEALVLRPNSGSPKHLLSARR